MVRTAAIAALAGSLLVAPAALAGTVSAPLTDSQLNAQFSDEAWVAEGRHGNNRPNGDWELGAKVGNDLNNTNFVWANEGLYRARVSWFASGFLKLDILQQGSVVGSVENERDADSFNAVAIRLAAPKQGVGSLSDIDFNGDLFNGTQLNVVQPPANDRARSLLFTGFDLSGDFTIEFDFVWEWSQTQGSAPAFQVKAGNVEVIPLPGVAGMGLAGLAAVGFRRRR